MERTICIWYPTWALRRPEVSDDQPAQAVDAANKVVACNEVAAREGIAVGMQRRAAEAICPTVLTIVTDDTADMVRFEPIVETIEAIVPRVEIAAPGCVFVPISGAVRYYGGEGPLVERIVKELSRFGGDHRLGSQQVLLLRTRQPG